MKSVSLRDRIIKYLDNCGCWVAKETIVEVAKRAYNAENRGITSEYINRELRAMSSTEGLTEPLIEKDDSLGYERYASFGTKKPQKEKPVYKRVIKDGVPVIVVRQPKQYVQ